MTSVKRNCTERHFISHDRQEIFFRHWPALSEKPEGAIILLHRGHEHSGRVAHIVDELGLDNYSFYAWDARGHGLTQGQRGYSPSFATTVRDLDCFAHHITETDGFTLQDMALIAQSVGAVIGATWVHDYAPPIRAMVLAAPAFDVKLYVPLAKEGIWLWQKLKGTFFVNSYVKARFLTHDKERIESFENDPLITRPIASNILLELYENADRIVRDARAITTPTQVLISGRDWVVRDAPQHRFYENLAGPVKERHVLKGFYHDTLGERDRALAFAKIRPFIEHQFAKAPQQSALLKAHIQGYTRDEADQLATPLPITSPRGFYWGMTRASIRIGALFSEGLKTGVRTGFDSGSTLDYVYRNEVKGLGPGGRYTDKTFLNAIGWRGIRQRKIHLEELIRQAVTRLQDDGKPARILDIAAGHGRYVLDALTTKDDEIASVRLQDYSPINVLAGRQLIAERNLSGKAEFHEGDAFDGQALAALGKDEETAPNLAIVSGLYELFADNDQIAKSLQGLAQAVQSGGYLIYTNQPWHPQLEMIARALTSHRGGQAWVMRRRTQNEMDQLVEAAGFRKIEQRIDQWGIFTVSLAQRIEQIMQLKSEVHKTDPALIRRGIVWLLLLAPLFYATYGLANWLASQRVAVPEIVFDWEKQIPFWGWTIIPYWSLNLFYAVAVLASISKQAQDRLVGRYLTAQCIAFVCFIAFPLTITWQKPATFGLSAWLFAMLGNFDQPFNQAPSLHIALAIIIWDHLRDRLPVFWRMIWHSWCLLIALSVLTTWQHHFIDIPAGALLGLFALWLFPHEGVAPWQDYRLTCDHKALQLAAIYGGAGLLLFALTFTAQHPAILLVLWPALALLLLGLAYSGGGAKFFQKRPDGSVSLASFWLFLPLRLFFRLNRIAWTWREPPAVKITEGLYLGRFPKHSETQNYARIIDMTAECIAPRNSRSRWQAFPLMDLAKPDLATLHAATTAIHDAPRPTLICCALGYQRSANLIARWLIESGEVADRQKAEELIRQTGRPVRLYPDHQ